MSRPVVLLLWLGATLAGQQGTPASGANSTRESERKNLAPVSRDILRVNLPRPVRRTVNNGLELLILENGKLPLVNIEIFIPASNLNEPVTGVAEGTADLLKSGSSKRTAIESAERLAEIGATLRVLVEYGSPGTTIRASCLTPAIDSLMDVLSDQIINPSFPDPNLQQWKTQKLASIKQMRAAPVFLCREKMLKSLYPGDSRSIAAADPDSIQRISRSMIVEFHRSHYRPRGSIVGISSNLSPDVIADKFERHFGGWTGDAPSLHFHPSVQPPQTKNILLIQQSASSQTEVIAASLAIGHGNPDFAALSVMNEILGGGPAARLFRNLRETKGLTYSIGSSLAPANSKYMAYFITQTAVRTSALELAVGELLAELRRIREISVPADELEYSKRALVARFALNLEGSDAVLRHVMLAHTMDLPAAYWEDYLTQVMDVTASDVQRVAGTYLAPDRIQLVVAGDSQKILPVLEKFGPVTKQVGY